MKKNLTNIIGAALVVCACSSNAANINGIPFSFAIDAANSETYSSNPGNDVQVGDLFTADSPFTVSTTFDISTGQKLIGVIQYLNSAASIGTLTGVTFGGQALDFSNRATGALGASVAIAYWDATSDITDGDFSVSFTGNIDEFSFTLYSLSGLEAGEPRDFVNAGGTMPSAEVLAGDFILATGQRNNGPNGYGGASTGMTLQDTGGAGNLKYGNASGFGDGDTIIADGGSSTGFLTNVNIDNTGTRFDLTSVTTFAAIPELDQLSLSAFAYNPADGSSSVSIQGEPNTRYQLVEADDLDFSNPDRSPIPLDGATVGVLDGDVVTTDANGDATIQFNLGTAKPATFIRAEDAPPPPPLLDENFDAAAALPAGWASSGPNNGTDWEVGVPSGVASGPAAPVSEPNCAGTNIGGYYTENTDVTLTSPSIPIPVAASATLTFRQLIDTDSAGDSGSVGILDADNSDAPIANLEITDVQGVGSSGEGDGWTTGTLALPAAEVGGKNIKIQFRFVSDAGSTQDTDVFGGFYIDDVLLVLD